MVTMPKRRPSMAATTYWLLPGPTTGMSSIERSAATPESLTVSMQTAS